MLQRQKGLFVHVDGILLPNVLLHAVAHVKHIFVLLAEQFESITLMGEIAQDNGTGSVDNVGYLALFFRLQVDVELV